MQSLALARLWSQRGASMIDAQHAAASEGLPAGAEESDAAGQRKVLEEMLGEDELDIGERQTVAHIEHEIDAGTGDHIDVRPAGEDLVSAAEVKAHGGDTEWASTASILGGTTSGWVTIITPSILKGA
jgi:hypothetical protein